MNGIWAWLQPRPHAWLPAVIIGAVLFSAWRRRWPTSSEFWQLASSGVGLYGAVVLWLDSVSKPVTGPDGGRAVIEMTGALGVGYAAAAGVAKVFSALWAKPVKPEPAEAASSPTDK